MQIEQRLREELAVRGGVLDRGSHAGAAECPVCAMELAAVVRCGQVSDLSVYAGLPGLHGINDSFDSAEVRTEAMLPLIAALWDWESWSDARARGWAMRCLERVPVILPKVRDYPVVSLLIGVARLPTGALKAEACAVMVEESKK